MARTFRRNDDDDEHTLRDGERVRLPMMLRDSIEHERSQRRPLLHDGRGGGLGHRPGYAFNRDAYAKDALAVEYAHYEENLQNAWKHGNRDRIVADAEGYSEGSAGSSCTVQNEYFPDDFGSPGTIQHVDGVGLICVPDGKAAVSTGNSSMSATEREYRLYDERQKNAWRSPK